MNVVVFGKGFGAPRQVNFSGRAALGVATLFAGTVAAIAFGAGLWYSSHNATGVSLDEARTVSLQLAEEREAIGSIRQQTEDTLDALNIRLGQLNARVIRLDALGRRLTEMAEIDGDEFNFDSEPAMGGPGRARTLGKCGRRRGAAGRWRNGRSRIPAGCSRSAALRAGECADGSTP